MHSHIFILTALSAAVTLLETKRDQWLSMVVVNGKEKAFAIVAEKNKTKKKNNNVGSNSFPGSLKKLCSRHGDLS